MAESQHLDPDHDAGKRPIPQESEGCALLWIETARLYAADAIAIAAGRADYRDGGEALDDLRGSRRILRRLCRMIDADHEAVARAIERAINKGHGAGLHPRPRNPRRKREAA